MYCINLLKLKKILRHKSTLQCSFIEFLDKSYNTDSFSVINKNFFCNFNVTIDSFYRNCCWYPVGTLLNGIDSRHICPLRVLY